MMPKTPQSSEQFVSDIYVAHKPLDQLNNLIIQDPHGDAARNAAHWLAVEVMGWGVKIYEIIFEIDIYYLDSEGERVMQDCDWQPFTDANHTLMVADKLGVWFSWSGKQSVKQFLLEVIISALGLCHAEGTLTNETIKEWSRKGGNQ